MYMLNRIILFWILVLPIHVTDQQCIVRGTAKGFEEKILAVVGLEEELSGKRNVLAQCEIGAKGDFEIQFSPGTTRRVYLHVQRIEAPLFVESGSIYEVVFPLPGKSDFRRFDNTEVALEIVNPNPADLNIEIRKFNSDYTRFISEHFYDFATDEYRGSKEYLKYLGEKKQASDLYRHSESSDSSTFDSTKNFQRFVKQFDDSVSSSESWPKESDFLRAYKRFSIAELYLLAGMNRKQFYETFFMSLQPPMHNPAFMECFKLFARNMLVGQKGPAQSAIVRAVNVDRDLDLLSKALAPESEIASERLRKMACINGLKEVYFNKTFDRASIDLLLGKVHSDDTTVANIAAAVAYQLKRCRAGWKIQPTVFTDENQEKWTLANADGMPVYMLFFATWSPNSLKEIQVLERWQEKFKGRVQIVAVCMDDDYSSYRKFLESNLKLPIKLLYGNAEPFVHEKFNLKSIPHVVLLDTEQQISSDVCPLPSEPLFESFLNRLAPVSPKKQGMKTWKDR